MFYEEAVQRYQNRLPASIREYLRAHRGLSDAAIEKFQIGWDGQRIAIPIRGRNGKVQFFKLGKAPGDTSDGPKMKSSFGGYAELYGWERAQGTTPQLVICEGEYDRLLLESRGYAAVTSTAGALTFRKEWAQAIARIPAIYICYDRDAAGEAGARLVGSMLREAKIVILPPHVGLNGDIGDFFMGLGKTIEDFDQLLAEAQPLADHERIPTKPAHPRPSSSTSRSTIEELKASVSIEAWIGAEVDLATHGRNFIAHCPFHEDHTPSFVVFPETQTFCCFGCGAKGDLFSYLMRTRDITFAEAMQLLRRSINDPEHGEGAA